MNSNVKELLDLAQEEHQVVSVIRVHLLTLEQRKFLFENGLSIEDLLNGRVNGNLNKKIAEMYKDWNDKIGEKYFYDELYYTEPEIKVEKSGTNGMQFSTIHINEKKEKSISERTAILIKEGEDLLGSFVKSYFYVQERLFFMDGQLIQNFCKWLDENKHRGISFVDANLQELYQNHFLKGL